MKSLKKLSFILVLLCSLSFASCSSDDESNNNENTNDVYYKLVEGNWVNKVDNVLHEEFTFDSAKNGYFITYKEYYSGKNRVVSERFTIDKDSIYTKLQGNYKYNISNNNLTLKNNTETFNLTKKD